MNAIERITPLLARTVRVVAAITFLGAIAVAMLVSEARLVGFAGFAYLAGAYAHKVLRESREQAPIKEHVDIKALAA